MRAGIPPDHGSLALHAQNQAAELRPLLLRVHVQNFVGAPRRDSASVASFEAIALGLIPLVPDDVLADSAAMLRSCEDVPRSIRDAVEERLGGGQPVSRPSPNDAPTSAPDIRDDGELAIARDLPACLGADTLAALVERAIGDAELAIELLRRPEPSVFDRAALYRHADEATRISIRQALGPALATVRLPPPAGASHVAREMSASVGPGAAVALPWALAAQLGVEPVLFDLRSPAGQELLFFGMMTIGLDESERLRILLLLDDPLAKSVKGVFRLVQLGRETPRAVAAFLAGYERFALSPRQPADEATPTRAGGSLRADGRADPIPRSRRLDRGARDRAPIYRLDRRP